MLGLGAVGGVGGVEVRVRSEGSVDVFGDGMRFVRLESELGSCLVWGLGVCVLCAMGFPFSLRSRRRIGERQISL